MVTLDKSSGRISNLSSSTNSLIMAIDQRYYSDPFNTCLPQIVSIQVTEIRHHIIYKDKKCDNWQPKDQ